MSDEFDLFTAIPDPLYFRDIDPCPDCDDSLGATTCDTCHGRGIVPGKRYKALTAKALGITAVASQIRLQRALQKEFAIVQDPKAPDDRRAAAGIAMEEMLNEFIAVLVPTMPSDRIMQLSSGYKTQFIDWWRKLPVNQVDRAASGEAAARDRVSRGRRSRASSTPATTPSTS